MVRAFTAATGETEWSTEDIQMMPPPTLGDVTGDGDPELVAPGNDGSVTVLNPASGSVLATYERNAPIYAETTLADTDEDSAKEIYVIYGDGRVVRLDYTD